MSRQPYNNWKRDALISMAILIPMFIVFFIVFRDHDKMVERLHEEGVTSTGVVVEIRRTTRGDVIYYKFFGLNPPRLFEGESNKTHNHSFSEGDSIEVVYLPVNPDKNLPNFQLE